MGFLRGTGGAFCSSKVENRCEWRREEARRVIVSLLRREARVSACPCSSRGEEIDTVGAGPALSDWLRVVLAPPPPPLPLSSNVLFMWGCLKALPLLLDRPVVAAACIRAAFASFWSRYRFCFIRRPCRRFMITSLIFGRYWSSDDGDGSSPRAVSRQFLRSSGICASSLFGDEPKEKQVRASLSLLRFFFLKAQSQWSVRGTKTRRRAGLEQEHDSNGMYLILLYLVSMPTSWNDWVAKLNWVASWTKISDTWSSVIFRVDQRVKPSRSCFVATNSLVTVASIGFIYVVIVGDPEKKTHVGMSALVICRTRRGPSHPTPLLAPSLCRFFVETVSGHG